MCSREGTFFQALKQVTVMNEILAHLLDLFLTVVPKGSRLFPKIASERHFIRRPSVQLPAAALRWERHPRAAVTGRHRVTLQTSIPRWKPLLSTSGHRKDF